MATVGSILTNMGALNALNSLSMTNEEISSSESQLSSGLSINSPADNPAGSIEAAGFTSQINGQEQALSNINTGISLAETAQGGIMQQTSIAQKLYSLAVEAANGTETSQDRSSLQQVANELVGEISNISAQTQFNGINLLNGTFSGVQFQTGADNGQTQLLSIQGTAASKLGLDAKSVGAPAINVSSYTLPGIFGSSANYGEHLTADPVNGYKNATRGYKEGNIKINGSLGSSSIHITSSSMSGQKVASLINAVSSKTGVAAKSSNSFTLSLSSGVNAKYSFNLDAFGSASLQHGSNDAIRGSSGNQIVNKINSYTGNNGISASLTSSGKLAIKQSSGYNVQIWANSMGNIETSSGEKVKDVGNAADTVNFVAGTQLYSNGSFSLTNASALGLQANSRKAGSWLSSINLTTVSGAQKAIGVIQAAISQLGQIGANIGAFQDGLQALSSNISQSTNNATTALGVVQDANIPQVTNNLTEEQIAAQSGIAALKASTQLQQSYTSLLP